MLLLLLLSVLASNKGECEWEWEWECEWEWEWGEAGEYGESVLGVVGDVGAGETQTDDDGLGGTESLKHDDS